MPDWEALIKELEKVLGDPLAAYYALYKLLEQQMVGVTYPVIFDDIQRQQALRQLRIQFRQAVRNVHQLAAILGNGGQPLTSRQMQTVIDNVAGQEKYIENFINEIPNLTEAAALARANLYATPALHTLAQIQAGQMPRLPHYPGDLDLACHGFCRCHLRIDKVGDNDWNVWWIVDPDAEHCPDCVAISAAWNPLEIRGGVIQGEERKVA